MVELSNRVEQPIPKIKSADATRVEIGSQLYMKMCFFYGIIQSVELCCDTPIKVNNRVDSQSLQNGVEAQQA